MSIQDQIAVALQKTYFYLKFRPRTEREVQTYLEKKGEKFGWPHEVIEQTIICLKKQNLINDKHFISWLVDSRSRTKPKSAFALRSELFKLGIPKELLDEHFSTYETDESELAIQALRPKWRRFQTLESRDRFQKAAAFLSRRGFSFDLIKKAIRTLEENASVE